MKDTEETPAETPAPGPENTPPSTQGTRPTKQAVVVVHGMGEQVPMQTLDSFVKAVWTTDPKLTVSGKIDPNTGGVRSKNASWAKPDRRNRSFELRRITTESDKNNRRTDFYEFYWAHLMRGNTWEHVKGWIFGLLLRRHVPKRVFHAWIALWILTLAVLAGVIWGLWPDNGETVGPAQTLLVALGGTIASAFLSNVLVKRFGDVARYVTPKPPNVACRQEIREKGVELLETLIESKKAGEEEYDRIIVVAHSLGAIVAYDVISHLFARYNKGFDTGAPQPERDRMEQMLRDAWELQKTRGTAESDAPPLDLNKFRVQQQACFAEARAQGVDWKISDFVTLGAPLTHAEFLMAGDKADLRDKQARRVLATCPPVLEYDPTTGLRHFTYVPGHAAHDPLASRKAHHAALFAYTRWTNLYSDHRLILLGDIISGPLAEAFGAEEKGSVLKGIQDIAVLPMQGADGIRDRDTRRAVFTHTSYWDMEKGTGYRDRTGEYYTTGSKVPHHIEELRKAIELKW